MKLVMKYSGYLVLLLLSVFLFSACDKEDSDDMEYTNSTPTNQMNTILDGTSPRGGGEETELCFEIQYPITVVFPDGTQQTVNSDAELFTAVDNWYDANPNEEEDITFVYPVEVVIDSMSMSIMDDETFEDLLDSCYEDCDEEYEDEFEEFFDEFCLDFVFPVTVVLPDGSSVTAADFDKLETAIFDWYDANPDSEEYPTFSYPIEVILDDSLTLVVQSDEELEEALEDCYDEDEEYIDELFDEICFDFVYPVTAIMPDGTTITANDFNELENGIDDWYDANPDEEEWPTLQYPVDITLEDGTTQSIQSDEELEDALEECEDD